MVNNHNNINNKVHQQHHLLRRKSSTTTTTNNSTRSHSCELPLGVFEDHCAPSSSSNLRTRRRRKGSLDNNYKNKKKNLSYSATTREEGRSNNNINNNNINNNSRRRIFIRFYNYFTSTMMDTNTNIPSSTTNTTVIPRLVTLVCFGWTCMFMTLYGTNFGKSFCSDITELIFSSDTKGGNPYVYLAIPILLAGTIATSLVTLPNMMTRTPKLSSSSSVWGTLRAKCHLLYASLLPPPLQRIIGVVMTATQKIVIGTSNNNGGDTNYFVRILILWFVIPITTYTLTASARKGFKLKSVANVLGVATLILLPLTLVPVARHSILVKAMNWSTNDVLFLHIWISRMVILGAILHGGIYMYRFKYNHHDDDDDDESDNIPLIPLLFPSKSCWMENKNEKDSNLSQSCSKIKRNFTGWMAMISFGLIGISSLGMIRRRWYKYFYIWHVILTPTAILFTVLHWNRSILYIAGGVLYYMASSFPVLIESSSMLNNKWSDNKMSSRLYSNLCLYIQNKRRRKRQSAYDTTKTTITAATISDIDALMKEEKLSTTTTTTTTTSSSSSVRIVYIEEIQTSSSSSDRSGGGGGDGGRIISLTLEASPMAMAMYRPGQYVQLHAPTVSMISHPFTVNHGSTIVTTTTTNTNKNNKNHHHHLLRIMFRTYGTFTTELATQLMATTSTTTTTSSNETTMKSTRLYKDEMDDFNDENDDNDDNNDDDATTASVTPPPPIYLDGFHGCPSRVSQVLQHDVFLMVAGGIGITPFLSLLQYVYKEEVQFLHGSSSSLSNDDDDDDDDEDAIMTNNGNNDRHSHNKRIMLHWMCRDSALIDYVSKEYFEPLLKLSQETKENETSYEEEGTFSTIDIVIHQTGTEFRSSSSSPSSTSYSDNDTTKNNMTTVPQSNHPRDDLATRQDEDAMFGNDGIEEPNTLARGVVKRIVPKSYSSSGGGGVPFSVSRFASGSRLTRRGNIPMLISFCLISWIGLVILWYYYNNVHNKNAIFSRLPGLIVATVLALVVSIVMTCQHPRCCIISRIIFQCVGDEESSFGSQGAYSTVSRTSTIEAEQKSLFGSAEHDAHVSEMELARVDHHHNRNNNVKTNLTTDQPHDGSLSLLSSSGEKGDPRNDVSLTPINTNKSRVNVRIVKKHGRPRLVELLQEDIDRAYRPGILVCGPSKMINEVTNIAKNSQKGGSAFCGLRTENNDHDSLTNNRRQPVSIYTDSFEM